MSTSGDAADAAEGAGVTIPRPLLAGAGLLLGFTLLTVGAARFSELGLTRLPDAAAVSRRALHFEDRYDGAIAVYRSGREQPFYLVAAGGDGFLRGVLRGLARERKRQGIDAAPPFLLTRWADGRLSLADPSTGREIALEAFGATNVRTFARLLTTPTDP